MIEHHLDIPTAEGAMNTFVVHPDEGGPHPVVLFYMDAPRQTRRAARHGAAPGVGGLLRGAAQPVLPPLARDYYLKERTPEAMAPMFEHMNSLNAHTTEVDTAAVLKFLDTQPAANASRIGMVGYCMSGPFVMWAAAQFPGRISSIASIHGAQMATDAPDSPHLMAPKINCEAYFACAEIDKWAPPADIAKLEASLKAAGTKHRIEWYPQVEHGFVFPQRYCYSQPMAERHWERLHSLFKRTLQA